MKVGKGGLCGLRCESRESNNGRVCAALFSAPQGQIC